jgi:putative phosphoesterase
MLWSMNIGIISDTHGVISKAAINALKGVDHILHAGDVGSLKVFEILKEIAAVTAVRGNTDNSGWSQVLPMFEMVELGGFCFCLLHIASLLDLDPAVAGIHVVISGHTHQPAIRRSNGILYFNPGSASVSRYGSPLCVGRIHISANQLHPEIIQLST